MNTHDVGQGGHLIVDGVDAFVFVIAGAADRMLGLDYNHNYRVTRQFASVTGLGIDVSLLHDDEPRGTVSNYAVGVWGGDPHRYAVEREAELLRRAVAPTRIPRLGGVFFFADLDSCQRVSERWQWWDLSTVRQGTVRGHVERFDMQLSSTLLTRGLVDDPQARERLWRHYLTGLPGSDHPDMPKEQREAEPIWEHLVNGVINFADGDESPFPAA